MSEGDPTDDEPHDESDRTNDDYARTDRDDYVDRGEREDRGWLSNLVSALERLDRLSESGDRRGTRTSLDYDVSIGSLDDLGDRRDAGRGGRDRESATSNRRERRSAGNRPGDRRQRPSPNRYNVTTQAHEDEVVITADVAGIDREDVTVGLDEGSVVVGVSGAEIERVRPPWNGMDVEAIVRNGVLTVRITEDSDE